MRRWPWLVVATGTLAFMFAAAQHTLTIGFLLADAAVILWAAGFHVILEPRWSIDDEIGVINTWTL